MSAPRLEEAHDERRFGGKAVGLGVALRAGFAVPPGFALAVELVDGVHDGASEALRACERILSALGGPVAVRSSAVGEDGASASFAGQHLTKLNVATREDLALAVREVRASARSESALAYRRRLGVAGEPRVAVVVQRMIAPACAGVLFTQNPVDGSDERVIEGTWGLGEAVVSGIVTPDRARLSRGGAVLEHVVGDKDLEIVAAPGAGTTERALDAARASESCLTTARLAALEALAARCEASFEGPSDVEWAFEQGSLWLLQRRAVTR